MILYLIRHIASGREYVGSTVRTASQRWRDHLSACFTKGVRSPLYSEMREFGRTAFELIEIERCADYEALMDRERQVILERNTLYPNGYNQVRGGRGNFGWQPSLEVRARMSKGQRGRKLSAEHKAKLSAAMKLRPSPNTGRKRGTCWNKGVPHSAETKAKMSAAHRGRPWSQKRHDTAIAKPVRLSENAKRVISNKKTAWWASLSPSDRAAHVQKMKPIFQENI